MAHPQTASGVRTLKEAAGEIHSLRRAAHERIAAAAKGVAFVKTHNAFIMDHGAPAITPHVTAGAVYVVRNPLDVVLSLKDHYGHRSIGDAIEQMNAPGFRISADRGRVGTAVGSWSGHVESWAGAPRRGILPVRYEDMLAAPEVAFARVIRTLGNDVDDARLRWAVGLASFDRLKAAEAETGFSERSSRSAAFFRKGVAGGWREALSPGQVRAVVGARVDQRHLALADQVGAGAEKGHGRGIPAGHTPDPGRHLLGDAIGNLRVAVERVFQLAPTSAGQ